MLNPQLIEEGARRFGAQCIVLSIDARRVPERDEAWSRIKRAAKKHGVEVSEKSWHELGKK